MWSRHLFVDPEPESVNVAVRGEGLPCTGELDWTSGKEDRGRRKVHLGDLDSKNDGGRMHLSGHRESVEVDGQSENPSSHGLNPGHGVQQR